MTKANLGTSVYQVTKYIQPSGDTSGATDTAVITAALVANADLRLAAGNFYINALLVIAVNQVSITGAGMGRTILNSLLPAATSGSPYSNRMIQVGNNYLAQLQNGVSSPTAVYVDRVVLKDFTIYPPQVTTRNLYGDAVLAVYGATNFVIDRVEVSGGDRNGISSNGDGNAGGVIQDCWIHDMAGGGMTLAGGNKFRVINNRFDNTGDDSLAFLAYNLSTVGYTIPNSYNTAPPAGTTLGSGSYTYDVGMHDSLASGNHITNAGASGLVAGGTYNIQLLNNIVDSTYGPGVRIANLWTSSVTYPPTTETKVAGNLIKNAGQSVNPGNRPSTDGSSHNGYDSGVMITTWSSPGSTQYDGLITGVTIENNRIINPAFNYIVISGTTIFGQTISDVTIRGNRCMGVVATPPATKAPDTGLPRTADGRLPIGDSSPAQSAPYTQTATYGAGFYFSTVQQVRVTSNYIDVINNNNAPAGAAVNITSGTTSQHRLDGNDADVQSTVTSAYLVAAGKIIAIGNNAIGSGLTSGITTTGATVITSQLNTYQTS